MFKLKKNRQVWWPVTINVPADGGRIIPCETQVQFNLLEQHEFDEYAEQSDEAALEAIMANWKGFADEQGEPLPFNRETLLAVLAHQYVRIAIFTAYNQACIGAAAKN